MMRRWVPLGLALVGVLMAVGLYQLPKVVVDDGEEVMAGTAEMPEASATEPNAHLAPMAPPVRAQIEQLRQKWSASENSPNFSIFADSLAAVYFRSAWYDSAAYFAEIVVEQSPTDIQALTQAGNYYYEAFSFASNGEAQAYSAVKAQQYLEQVLEQQPENLEAKAKLGLTYVVSTNPMQGVLMLREVVEADPDNVLALFNLGMLSRQSGQMDKAVERFENVVAVEPGNLQARFFLGLTHQEMGNNQAARATYEELLDLTRDPAVIQAVNAQLESLE